ncbi:hypothetical protein ZIOFF_032165 [Zingiber officinale]|uniref:Uncharacterized protein n=1 Tax=Zingiber officinale TaxID=94328 RepID=A0A8J5GV57_ZINOF|nr:hypothetical protein ZIOFF_032165 [Zingiber officinale]
MAVGSSSSTSFTRRRMNDAQGETPHILFDIQERGCGFFLWHDPELSERTKGIINDLKRDNKKLQMEISELKKSNMYIESAVDCNVLLKPVNNSVTMKLSDEICSLNRKFRVAIVVVVFTWIVMIWRWLV